MRKLTYYAVFEPSTEGSYGVYWPDLPGCTSYGETIHHAEIMAAEALGLHIYSMEQDGDPLPEATTPPFKEMPMGGIIMPVTIFPDIVNNELDNRAVKTNITLPAWLKDWAGTQGINLSQTLQTTLRQMHDAHQ
jgi:predicted RNase H-like HicB family nuclease